MGYIAVIISFSVCLFFNVFLNSFDVYSDTILSFNTMTYRLGDSLLLSGCRVCHKKEDSDVFKVNEFPCKSCFTKNTKFYCGRSFEILNKIDELQNKDICENEHFSLNYNEDSNTYNFRNKVCDSSDECCLESKKSENSSNILAKNIEHIDKRILAYHIDYLDERILKHHFDHSSHFDHHRHQIDLEDYEIYILSANFGNYYCHGVFWDYFKSNKSEFKSFLEKNITKLLRQSLNEVRLEYHFKFIHGPNDTILLRKGFDNSDKCGFLVQNKQKNYAENSGQSCSSDSCLVHLQRLKYKLSITNLSYWRQETFFKHGIKLGGKTCELLWKYGIASLVPILINMIFNVLVFLDDIETGKTSKFEFIFVIALFYPQWKTLRFLTEYLYHKNEAKLNEEKEKFDNHVGSLEPFLESAFQVGNLLYIS